MSKIWATRRLTNEYKSLKSNPIQNIFISLNNNDLFNWKIIIFGPYNTPYDGIIFRFNLIFYESYPFKFGSIHFPEGFCTCGFSNILSNWSPTMKIIDILESIYELFKSPNINNCFTNQLNAFVEKNKGYNLKNNYDFMNEIENRTYSSLFKVKNKKTNEIRVIKIIKKNELNNKLKEQYNNDIKSFEKEYHDCINDIYDEITFMEMLNDNDNSIKYYDNYHNKNEFGVIMELCDDNLISFLQKKKILKNKEIYYILCQLNNIFKIISEKKITLRNLKPQNILIKYDNKVKEKYLVKLSDYKVSNIWNTLDLKLENSENSILTFAPEILKGENPSSKSNLWSLGIIIYFLVFNQYPYSGNADNIIKQIDFEGINY